MIRLMRFGRRHQPFFRLVVVPKRSKPTRGQYVDALGWVDPVQHKRSVNVERAKHWLAQGAQPSDTVWNLFVNEGVVSGKKRPVHTRTSPEEATTIENSKESSPETVEQSKTVEAKESKETVEEAPASESETPEAKDIDTEKKE